MNIENLTKVDKERMFETYDLWPEIARDAHEKDFEKIDAKDIDHIVFAGMGGSG